MIFIILLIIILGFFWYIGAFEKVRLEEGEHGGYITAGLDHKGPYKDLGKVFFRVEKIMKDLNINATHGFGIYYNNPKTTPKDELHSYVGSVLPDQDNDRKDEVIDAGLRIDEIPRAHGIYCTLPVRTNLSYMLNPMKAYPALSKHLERTGGTMTTSYEIYDLAAKKATYVMHFTK